MTEALVAVAENSMGAQDSLDAVTENSLEAVAENSMEAVVEDCMESRLWRTRTLWPRTLCPRTEDLMKTVSEE